MLNSLGILTIKQLSNRDSQKEYSTSQRPLKCSGYFEEITEKSSVRMFFQSMAVICRPIFFLKVCSLYFPRKILWFLNEYRILTATLPVCHLILGRDVKSLNHTITINCQSIMSNQPKLRSSHWSSSIKKVFLKSSQSSQENTCARVSF